MSLEVNTLKKPLHELDSVVMSYQLKEKTLQKVFEKKRRQKNTLMATLSFATCVIFVFFLRYSVEKQTEPLPLATPYAYVSFDINPSLEFYLDEQNQVMEVISYTSDSDEILPSTDLQGYEVIDAIQLLMKQDKVQAYMENGFLQVRVYSDDRKRITALEQKINASLATILNQNQYSCSCASKREQEEANRHHMSFGRYQMMDMIIGLDSTYSLAMLQEYSMRELRDLYAELSDSDAWNSEHHKQTMQGHHQAH